MDKEYVYNYLSDEGDKSIRLLTILPGATADPVFVKLEEFHLDEDWELVVDYIALSYTWDSPGAEKRIHIGENGEEGFMLIRPNVDSALRKLRSSADEEHHVVWIDAICIDQNDDDEKMKQVAMMGEIYSKALGTMIWLGDADDRTELGLRACDVLAKAYWKMNYGDEMDEDAAAPASDSWETESADSMDIVGMKATKTVKAILGCSNGSRSTCKARGKKRKREDDAEKDRSRIERADLSSLLYAFEEEALLPKERLLGFDNDHVISSLRERVASDRQLFLLRKAWEEQIHTPAHLVMDAMIQHLKILLERPHDELEGFEEFANMDFGMPFGPALCIDAANRLERDRLEHGDLSIGHIQYTSILRWSLLFVLSGDLGLSDNYHRVDYLDLAAPDTVIRSLWYRIGARSYEAEPDPAVWQVDNILGVGFAETLGSLDPKRSIANVIDAIASVLARPWFERMWTQQELVLARSTDVMIGEHNVDWNMLVDADLFCYTNDLDYGPSMGRCVILDSRRTNRTKNALSELLTIGSLAESARNAKSSDPRDKIYGWLGLLNDEQQMFKITPDYRLSTKDVYEKFTFNAIKESRNLIIPALRLPGDSAKLPSWVPDFNYQQGKYVENLGHLQRHYSHFSASAGSETHPRYSAAGALLLRGRVIDTVRVTSVSWTSRQRPGERRQHKPWTPGLVIETWAKFVRKFTRDPYSPTGEALADAFWKTLVQGRKMEGGAFTAADRLAALSTVIDFFKADLALPADVKSSDLGGDYTEDINWRGRPELLWMYLSEELETLRLFVSAAGRLGLGHYDVEAGDRIVLFAGGNMPFLVRSVGGNNKIVSVCYLHGAMRGELWPSEHGLEDIELC